MLFISFLIQPFHQALANEEATETEQVPQATDVKPDDSTDSGTGSADVSTLNQTDPEPNVIDEVDPGANLTQPTPDADSLIDDFTDTQLVSGSEASTTDSVEIDVTSSPDTMSELVTPTSSESEINTPLEVFNASSSQYFENVDSATSTESVLTVAEDNEILTSATGTPSDVSETTLDLTASSSELVFIPGAATSTQSEVSSSINELPVTSTTTEQVGNESASESENNPAANLDNSGSNITTQQEAVEDTEEDVSANLEKGEPTTNPPSEDDKSKQQDDKVKTEQAEEEIVIERQSLTTEDNFYQFSRQSCVPVGDGTFHCSIADGESLDERSTVYAQKDADGDMEIFLRAKNKKEPEQLTDNDLDDTSPYLDVESKRVVWQRLIDGRYQIMVYDIAERNEMQLTFSKNNNMEPKSSPQGIVWQAWDGSDWEIMYFDGLYTTQITDNSTQDVAPVIQDNYILWSILGGDEREARVYSLKTEETNTISGYEGGELLNPRFVLVYDTRFDNGDVVTQSFDPVTGVSMPIAAKPAPAPVDIPDVDPIGEIRALVQNKSPQKEKSVAHVLDNGAADGSDLVLGTKTGSSSTTTLDLNKQIQLDLDQMTLPTTTNTVNDFELSEYDLVITPNGVSTSSIATSSIKNTEPETVSTSPTKLPISN